MTPRKKEQFQTEILPEVAKTFNIKNKMALPEIEKIVLNVGMGKELDGMKVRPHVVEQVLKDLTVISGQKPVLVAARKSVSNFKVREGSKTHAKVTLRGDRMWEFYDRLVSLAIPRVKDFRGLKDTSFDPQGNYSFGVTEQAIFLEVDMANATYNHGMNINIVFKKSNPELSKFILSGLGFPFVKREEKNAA